ncbi:MAG TPA: hypothetical protein VEA69_21595 [Tepidisphaeraceae bacterium]|nr:hypothetical protein [Tepidisphaeraceae bacterium]
MANQIQYGLGGDRPYGLYYEHSGQTPVLSIVLTWAVGMVVGAGLAAAYAYVMAYIPGMKLAALATVGFGAAVGALVTLVGRAGKVRSTPILMALVGVCTLVAYYAAWVFWLKAVIERGSSGGLVTVWEIASEPVDMVRTIQAINEVGTWKMGKSDREAVRGTFLTILWGVEFLTIFGSSFGAAAALSKARVFCEKCRRWSGTPVGVRTAAAGDADVLRRSLEAHDWTYAATLPPPSGPESWEFQVYTCPGCRQTNALTVRETKQTLNKKGAVVATTSRVILDKLLVSEAEVNFLRAGPVSPAAQSVAPPAVPHGAHTSPPPPPPPPPPAPPSSPFDPRR